MKFLTNVHAPEFLHSSRRFHNITNIAALSVGGTRCIITISPTILVYFSFLSVTVYPKTD